MDYAFALIVYICSILGVFWSTVGIIAYKDDKIMVNFCSLSMFVFVLTIFLGGTMLNAVN